MSDIDCAWWCSFKGGENAKVQGDVLVDRRVLKFSYSQGKQNHCLILSICTNLQALSCRTKDPCFAKSKPCSKMNAKKFNLRIWRKKIGLAKSKA